MQSVRRGVLQSLEAPADEHGSENDSEGGWLPDSPLVRKTKEEYAKLGYQLDLHHG
jgi:hypothetical protein